MTTHLDQPDRTTACFVHSLIAGEWVTPLHKLDDIDEVQKGYDTQGPAVDDSAVIQDDVVSVVDLKNKPVTKDGATIIQSRHLTKRQLSDMAWNVRKLSKKLGSIRLKLSVKTVFVVTKVRDESLYH